MAGRIDNPVVPPVVNTVPPPAAPQAAPVAAPPPPPVIQPRSVSPTENLTPDAARAYGIGGVVNAAV